MIRWLLEFFKRRRAQMHRDWASVPPPEWAAKRGWRDYW